MKQVNEIGSLRTATRPETARILGAIGIVGGVLLWWTCSSLYANFYPERVAYFPNPFRVLRAGIEAFRDGLATDLGASVLRVLIAFLISSAIAAPLGILMGCWRWLNALVSPLVDFLRYVPVPSVVGLIVLFAGIDEGAKFLVLLLGTIFQQIVMVIDAVENVPEEYFVTARTLGLGRFRQIRHVLIPAIRPQLFDIGRVTLGWCWTYLVIAELVAAPRGIGRIIREAERFQAVDRLLACCVILGVVGLTTDWMLKVAYRHLFSYAAKSRSVPQ